MLGLFVAALGIPAWLLLSHALGQLKWEAYYDARQAAQLVAQAIDSRLTAVVNRELARQPDDYGELLNGESGGSFRDQGEGQTRTGPGAIPGMLGHFQVDNAGQLSAPALPASAREQAASNAMPEESRSVNASIASVLAQNQLIGTLENSPPPASGAASPAAASPAADDRGALLERAEAEPVAGLRANVDAPAEVDKLSDAALRDGNRFDEIAKPSRQRQAASKQQGYGRVADLKLETPYEEKLAGADRDDAEATVPAPASQIAAKAPPEFERSLRVTAFENQTGAFRFSLLDSGHFVLFRNVWRDGERWVQGVLIDQKAFLAAAVGEVLEQAAPDLPAQLLVAYGGSVLGSFSAGAQVYRSSASDQLSGELLYQARLTPPLSDLELIFLAGPLPLGASLNVLLWLGGSLAVVLLAGSLLIYRLGTQQLTLARQQRDFVSAVSHELKTPLTSIRMYGEMLTHGLAPEDRKPDYYRFIFDESERLSRLIENVLQLARLDRKEFELSPTPLSVSQVLDLVRSRVDSQVDAAGFDLKLLPGGVADRLVCVDPDAMVQIFINLVDNALKFCQQASRKQIDLGAHAQGSDIVFTLRDYGPGIARDQLGKVFELFYRSESELTRETVGTGIGLALVQQLAAGMAGQADVRQCQPGSEFTVKFRAAP